MAMSESLSFQGAYCGGRRRFSRRHRRNVKRRWHEVTKSTLFVSVWHSHSASSQRVPYTCTEGFLLSEKKKAQNSRVCSFRDSFEKKKLCDIFLTCSYCDSNCWSLLVNLESEYYSASQSHPKTGRLCDTSCPST